MGFFEVMTCQPMSMPYQGAYFDIKSKRALRQVQQTLVLTLLQDAVTTPAKNVQWFARTLLALP